MSATEQAGLGDDLLQEHLDQLVAEGGYKEIPEEPDVMDEYLEKTSDEEFKAQEKAISRTEIALASKKHRKGLRQAQDYMNETSICNAYNAYMRTGSLESRYGTLVKEWADNLQKFLSSAPLSRDLVSKRAVTSVSSIAHMLGMENADDLTEEEIKEQLRDMKDSGNPVIADEKGVVGSMVADATEEGPQLLSIGISSSLCGQGIGTELLDFAIEQLTEQYMPLLEETPLTFWAEEARKPDEWESLSHFLMKNGFQEKETALSSTATLEELLKSKTIVRALKRKKSPNVFSLSELPPTTLRAFSNACIEERLYPGIRKEDLAEDVSIFYVSGQKVLACVLMREAENKALENEWFYLSPDAKNMMILLDVFSRLAEEMEKRYPPDTQISFLPVNEAGEKLLRYIVPGTDEQFELRRYEMPFIAPGDYVREEGYE
ncbi:MAG: hypothetical protein IJU50_06405, partial [Lachnospiraceae bacterium]|nr:hypothetical protein [Lachnospiraceae bacterium]